MLTGLQIRRKFLEFFEKKGHKIVHSSSLVPHNDPTLLFTNAGMNQFKDVFLGLEKRDYTRATSSQKCVRAGGKHNDLENVGFTNRHHTFFEMLGNFSFGDYFKKDAIAYAWELITSDKWFGIPTDKLFVTILKGEGGVPRDAEAYDLWVGQGVAKDRMFEFGLKDNFWQMGDTGPCGPCSEIHYDMGPAASGLGHTDCAFGCGCGRYVEIWNLVFMQFDRDPSGKLNPLPKPSIDTGAGLERLAAVLRGVISNYETDLFTPLIKRAAELTGTSNEHVGADALVRPAEQDSAKARGAELRRTGEGARPHMDSGLHTHSAGHKSAASLRVIADHSRAATFLISDGVLPSNEGRGYVLRKIIRRAITHGRLLGQTKPFLYQMVFAVRDLVVDAYPELKETADRVPKGVLSEEQRFAHTLDLGLRKLGEDLAPLIAEKYLAAHPGTALDELRKIFGYEISWEGWGSMAPRSEAVYPGDKGFKLYDTFGMPLDFIQDAVRDVGLAFDQAGFDRAMAEQRERARASWKGSAKKTASPAYRLFVDGRAVEAFEAPAGYVSDTLKKTNPQSVFVGYETARAENCEVLFITKNNQVVRELKPGEEGEVILDHTPFYAESGGQVGDRGVLYSDELNTVVAEVKGCYYPVQGVRAHQVIPKQPIRVGDKVDAVVDTA